MNRCLPLVLGAAAVLAGCGSTTPPEPERTCATDIDVGQIQPFGEEAPSRTEGITFDEEGDLFVSSNFSDSDDSDDQLLMFMPDGTYEVVAEAESILGIASDSDEIIGAGFATGDLLVLDPRTGGTEVLAQDLGAPNFVLPTLWDTILVSDDTDGTSTITEVTLDGEVSVWSEGVPTPNGMVFSLDRTTLYVAATFDDIGLWRVPVSEEGDAGVAEKWVTLPENSTPDGVAIDSLGNVYVSLTLLGQIVQVAPDGTVTVVAEGLRAPASLAFGQGEYDPCSLYVTSLSDPQVRRVGIGILGTEQ